MYLRTYLPAWLPTNVHTYIKRCVCIYTCICRCVYVSTVCTKNGGSHMEWTASQQFGWQMATMGAWVGQVYCIDTSMGWYFYCKRFSCLCVFFLVYPGLIMVYPGLAFMGSLHCGTFGHVLRPRLKQATTIPSWKRNCALPQASLRAPQPT